MVVTAKSLPRGVSLVTGATGGMGSQCARLLAEASWTDILLCDLDETRLEALAMSLQESGASVATLAGDLRTPADISRIAQALGSREIAALIHTAGISSSQTSDSDVIFDVNLDATLRLLDVARPRMAAGGAAVLFASIAAHLPVSPEADATFDDVLPADSTSSVQHLAADADTAYLLSKRGVRAVVKREAKRWYRERAARLLSVSPGMIDTAMLADVDNNLTRSLFDSAAISRLGRPEEVAAVCVFLCSPAASFITGVDLLIDGGEFAGLGI